MMYEIFELKGLKVLNVNIGICSMQKEKLLHLNTTSHAAKIKSFQFFVVKLL